MQYLPDKLKAATLAGAFKVTRLLPSTGRDQHYSIRNALEPYERIARESQLQLG